jgi:hypothetical protein
MRSYLNWLRSIDRLISVSSDEDLCGSRVAVWSLLESTMPRTGYRALREQRGGGAGDMLTTKARAAEVFFTAV